MKKPLYPFHNKKDRKNIIKYKAKEIIESSDIGQFIFVDENKAKVKY